MKVEHYNGIWYLAQYAAFLYLLAPLGGSTAALLFYGLFSANLVLVYFSSKFLLVLPWIPKNSRWAGTAVLAWFGPTLISKYKSPRSTLENHEFIHLLQMRDLFIVGFFIWYGIEFLYHWFKIGNTYKAYKNISFEKEANYNELDLNYRTDRPIFAFLKYLKTSKQ